MDLKKEINLLKTEKNALILAHYYQRPEIQEIADYVGDSYYLSKFAKWNWFLDILGKRRDDIAN